MRERAGKAAQRVEEDVVDDLRNGAEDELFRLSVRTALAITETDWMEGRERERERETTDQDARTRHK